MNKHAMHLVRLYYTAFDILEEGKIITRRDKEREELLAIRNGAFCGAQRQLVRWPTAAVRR